MSETPMRARVLVPFIIATLVWSTTWIVIRGQLGAVPPTWSVAYRFLVAAIAMFVYVRATGAPLTLDRRGHGFAMSFGFAQFVLNFNFVYRAEAHITSGLVAVLFALLLVPNAVFGAIVLKQPVTGRFLAGSLIAITGVGMMILQELRVDTGATETTLLGVGLTLAGVMSASVANIMQGSAQGRAQPMATSLAWGMTWGTLFNGLIALITVGPPMVDMSASYIGGVLYLGVFASAVAFTCYFGVIREIGPARAAYSGVLTPIIAMLISTAMEDYRWSLLAAAGGIAAIAGLLIALSARKPSP